jgi:hypothetical protein
MRTSKNSFEISVWKASVSATLLLLVALVCIPSENPHVYDIAALTKLIEQHDQEVDVARSLERISAAAQSNR